MTSYIVRFAPPGWLSGKRVVLMSGYEFNPRLGQNLLRAYFRLSSLQKHVRNSSRWLWKEICVSTG